MVYRDVRGLWGTRLRAYRTTGRTCDQIRSLRAVGRRTYGLGIRYPSAPSRPCPEQTSLASASSLRSRGRGACVVVAGVSVGAAAVTEVQRAELSAHAARARGGALWIPLDPISAVYSSCPQPQHTSCRDRTSRRAASEACARRSINTIHKRRTIHDKLRGGRMVLDPYFVNPDPSIRRIIQYPRPFSSNSFISYRQTKSAR